MSLTQEYLKECVSYDPATGVFWWKSRPEKHFDSKRAHSISNSRDSGNIAGVVTARGYRAIKINGKSYQAHRLAWLYMKGSWPQKTIDHINGRKLDNRIDNLRDVSQGDNCKNQARRKGENLLMGVYWSKRSHKWQAGIRVQGKQVHLGFYESLLNAVAARKSAEKKYCFHHNHGRAA